MAGNGQNILRAVEVNDLSPFIRSRIEEAPIANLQRSLLFVQI